MYGAFVSNAGDPVAGLGRPLGPCEAGFVCPGSPWLPLLTYAAVEFGDIVACEILKHTWNYPGQTANYVGYRNWAYVQYRHPGGLHRAIDGFRLEVDGPWDRKHVLTMEGSIYSKPITLNSSIEQSCVE